MPRALPVLYLSALALGAALVALALGRFGFPLDDAYIYLRYADVAADGLPFRYAAGEPATTGATSLLWLALVGLVTVTARLVPGSGPEAVAAGVTVLHAAIAAIAFHLAYRLCRRAGVPAAAAWLPAGLALATPLWFLGAFNGMETGLHGMGLLAGAWVLAGGRVGWLIPLALARPEGAGLAAVVLVIRVFRDRGADGDAGPGHRVGRGTLVWVAVAVALGLAWPWLVTGSGAASWAAKGLWNEPHPVERGFYTDRLLYFAGRTLWFGLSGARVQPPLDLAEDLTGHAVWPAWVWAGFLAVGVLLGLARRRGRLVTALWIAASLAALNAIAWDAQHYRYLIAGYPVLLTAATIGWFGRAGLRGPGRGEGSALERRGLAVAGALAAMLAVTGSWSQPGAGWSRLVWLQRGECERLRLEQGAAGDWIKTHLPANARIATHDVGAIAYVGDRPVVDLVGLVTPELRAAYRHGEGAMWEALTSLPAARRPTHAAVVPSWMPYLYRTLWFAERLHPEPGERRRPTSREFEIWRLSDPATDRGRWPGGDYGDVPAGFGPAVGEERLEIVDRVDLADLASERDHGYRELTPPRPEAGEGLTLVRDLGFDLRLSAPPGAHAVDGGRLVRGAVTFTLRARPGSDGILVLRSATPRAASLSVQVGSWRDALAVPRGESRFAETAVVIPASVLGNGEGIDVRIEGDAVVAFHWWLLQTAP